MLTPTRNQITPLTKEIVENIFNALTASSTLTQVRDSLIIALAFTHLLRHDEGSHLSQAHFQARILLSFPPPWWGGVGKIKGSGDGEGNQRGKKEKKRKFGENITFDSTKS